MKERRQLYYLYNNDMAVAERLLGSIDDEPAFTKMLSDIYGLLEYGAGRYDLAALSCSVEYSLLRTFNSAMRDINHLPMLAKWQADYGIMDRNILKKSMAFIPSIKKEIKDYNRTSEVTAGGALAALEGASGRNYMGYVTDRFLNAHMFDFLNFNVTSYQFHEVVALYAHDKSLFKNFLPEMDYLIGLFSLRKDTGLKTLKKHIEDGKSKGVIPTEFDIDNEVERLKNDLSWVKFNDTSIMKTLIKKKWTSQELDNHGFGAERIMSALLSDYIVKKKSKTNRSYIIELGARFRGALSPELDSKLTQVVSEILLETKHPISMNSKAVISEANLVLANDFTSPESKLAAHVHMLKHGCVNIREANHSLNEKAVLKTISSVLPKSKTVGDAKFEHDLYKMFGLNSSSSVKTARQNEISRKIIEADLGL